MTEKTPPKLSAQILWIREDKLWSTNLRDSEKSITIMTALDIVDRDLRFVGYFLNNFLY